MQPKQQEEGKRQNRYSSSSSHNNNNSCLLVDRLPDDVLVRILSLLPTRECVRSSILGKRWRHLWARVPNLKLYSRDHKTLTSLKDFFNRFVFVHKGHTLNTLRIACHDDDDMETFFATAVACNVQILDIRTHFVLVLPHCIFTCKTLVDLTLNRTCVNNVPMDGTTVVYLPALKKLQLIHARYESEESLGHLLSGCPVLEKLTIIKDNKNVLCLNVSSPTLTSLNLEIDYVYALYDDCEVKLDTPALKYLRLHDTLSRDFSTEMLASLTEADVSIDEHPVELDVDPHSVLEFVGKLNNVSCLELTTDWLDVPDSAFSDLTTEFRNLTKLQLDGDWRFVTYFLENSDYLQVLAIGEFDGLQEWMEPKQVPACLIYHLRTVRCDAFECLETEFNMVEYILRNAKVLKRMEIYFPSHHRDLKKKSEARKRISLFERASEACQIAFH